MKYINIVVINGEEKEITTLPEEERRKMVDELNRRSLKYLGYQEIKTA